jgi:uncharacterized membrane protein
MFKVILYAILGAIAIGLATILVLSAKVIGFIMGILVSILICAIIIFLFFTVLVNGSGRTKEDVKVEKQTKKDYRDRETREFI